jgi:phage shock protein PspC (stress-responsive transcriptional regulator)
MNKVVNVNLSGNAYQVEEDGFASLNDYLESARLRLQGNPDLEEIMDDLEQSVADKMNRFLSARKTVVTAAEVDQIVDEMGPVDGSVEDNVAAGERGSAQQGTGKSYEEEPAVRKLYKLTSGDEKMLTGVCAGLAAYFGIDVTIVRIVFIALAFASAGLVILFYLLLALIVPAANTPQQHAAAYGVPFDAREVIERAKSKFNDLRSGKEWKAQQRYWNRHARNAGFDGVNSVLGLVVVLFGILIGLLLLRGIFFAIGFPMYIGGFHSPGAPWWAILLMVIIGVYLIGWVFGERNDNERSGLGSVLIKTAQVLSILLIVYVAFRILF